MAHECIQQENIGKFKEFIGNMKGMRPILWSIVTAIIIQVAGFLYLWGCLVTTVNYHDRALEKVCNKLDNIKIVGYAMAAEEKK